MTTKLPRPSARVSIVDTKGLPTPAHLRYFESLAVRIENALADLTATDARVQDQIERLTVQTISTSYANGLTITVSADGATAKAVISDHTRVYTDMSVSVVGATLFSLPYNSTYSVYYDDPTREGGSVTYIITPTSTEAVTSAANPFRHFVGAVMAPPNSAAPDETGSSSSPPSFPTGDFRYDA